MTVHLPTFRNLMTTGNMLSAMVSLMGMSFVAGIAWNDLDNKAKSMSYRIDNLEKHGDKSDIKAENVVTNVEDVKRDIVRINQQIAYISVQLQESKKWLEKISDQISSVKR